MKKVSTENLTEAMGCFPHSRCRDQSLGEPTPTVDSNFAGQNENEQNNHHETQTVAWILTPILTVRPGGVCADQRQSEDDE